jgi:hypothetical protein
VGLRGTVVTTWLGVLGAAPLVALLLSGAAPGELLAALANGLAAEVESVGLVLVPQLVLAVGIVGQALQQGVRRAAGLPRLRSPGWIPPAVESVLLLGLLGTVSGMVSGFVDVSADVLEPAPLVRGLGQALRSTFVGFAIALVGVWFKEDEPTSAFAGIGGEGSPFPPHRSAPGRPGSGP